MRNLAPRALTAADWFSAPAWRWPSWPFGKASAWAGFNTDYALDVTGTVYANLNDQITQANAELRDITGSYETVVVRLDDQPFEIEAVNLRDMDNDGRVEVVGGFGAGEYLLGADLDGNGVIYPPTEVIGRGFGGNEYSSADDALASLDGNGDGLINASDAAYAKLYLVGPAIDGGTIGRIKLSAAGITAIDLGDTGPAGTRERGPLGSTLDGTIGVEGIVARMAVANLGIASGQFDLVDQSGAAGETIDGLSGNDLLYALHSGVTLNGGYGSDVLVSTFADTIMNGGPGQDIGVFVTSANVTVNAATFGLEAVVTGAGNDILSAGSNRATALEGGRGADTIYGGGGNDTLIGGLWNDTIFGGVGFDIAYYRGSLNDFNVSAVTGAFIVDDLNTSDGDEGRDRLAGVEVVRFADGVVWLGSGLLAATPGRAPWVFDDALVSPSSTFIFTASDLIGNDEDPEGGPLTLASVTASAGTLTQLPDGNYQLVAPRAGDMEVTLVYTVADGDQLTSESRATVAFRPLPADPLMDASWHLFVDNVRATWPDYTGRGIHVAINEPEDFATTHPEIAGAYLGNLPSTGTGAHGIVVASVLLSALDGAGTAGVAPDAEFSKWVLGSGFDAGHEFFASWASDPFGDADIVNNSWTYSAFARGSLFQDYSIQRDGLEAFAAQGRGGLGGIAVFSSVNIAAGSAERLDYQYLHSARQAIAVNCLDETGEAAGGAPGAAVLISASGADMPTADLQGDGGYAATGDVFGPDYAVLTGTSLAAPMISGIVAMMLEANPDLGYRDVQQILAYSARMTDARESGWKVNGAHDWNGGGLRWNEDYGFGRVDALAAVRLAETWHEQRTEANLEARLMVDDGTFRYAAPDSVRQDSRVFDPATHPAGGDIIVEHVEVTLHGITEKTFDGTLYDTIADTYRLSFDLRSPSGTVVTLTSRAGPYDSAFIPRSGPSRRLASGARMPRAPGRSLSTTTKAAPMARPSMPNGQSISPAAPTMTTTSMSTPIPSAILDRWTGRPATR